MTWRWFPLGLGVAWALLHAVLGCEGTAGPLVVRNHTGGTGGSTGAAGAAGAASGGTSARPAIDVSWQAQLSGTFDASVDVALYYVDLDNLTSTDLLAITSAVRHLACYLSAGTHESWRSDAASFPAEVLGNTLADYPDERWLDIRSSVVAAVMRARLDRFRSDGCSSVAIANVTTLGEDSGFEVTTAEQSDYLVWLSTEIHQRGILAGLATADDRLADMEPNYDWAYAQSCWVDTQCSGYAPFVSSAKAVLAVEFGDATTAPTLCQGVAGSGINLLVKPRDLGASHIACSP